MKTLPKHVHIVGICGVLTGAVAAAFHKAGVKVTGSDKGFYPPASTQLEALGITFHAGWHPEKMFSYGTPDFIAVSPASGGSNPETEAAQAKGIPVISCAEVVGEYITKDTSIVCCGTWGKTSSTALISYILMHAGKDPSYFFGGISLSHVESGAITGSDISVVEGDEYKTSPTDIRPKFAHYNPTHVLLSAVSWDHADVYPTEESFTKVFQDLVTKVDKRGYIFACIDSKSAMDVCSDVRHLVTYGKDAGAQYRYEQITSTPSGLSFSIVHSGNHYPITSQMLGEFQAENITGCFAVCHSLGINPEQIIRAIASFKGMKRRLEKRFDGKVTVFDDIAHSPKKAQSVIKELKTIYSGKTYVIFEPNTGGRERAALSSYDYAFREADAVYIPRLTKLKVREDGEQPIEGDELTATIAKTYENVKYVENDEELVSEIVSKLTPGDVVAFLGSHGFRGMIEDMVKKCGEKYR